jgi:hypothetical protein
LKCAVPAIAWNGALREVLRTLPEPEMPVELTFIHSVDQVAPRRACDEELPERQKVLYRIIPSDNLIKFY